MGSLFRPEAVAARGQQWLGRVQLVRPLSLSMLTAGALVMVLAVSSFVALAGYTRKATTSGVLVPDRGLIRMVPAVSGVVLERRVSEGQTVQAGDVLFVLALERTQMSADVQERVQRSLDERKRSLQASVRQQQALSSSQQAALDRRLQALAGELTQLDAESGLVQQRLGLARQALARLESLQREQFISSAQVQAKSEELLGVQAAAQGLARQRAALEREREDLLGQRRALPLLADGAAGGIERELALLSREAAEVDAERQVLVRAPQAGTVSALLAEPGQSVSPASALASLVPAGAALQAHLYAPSSAMGFVRAGQPVRMRFEAFPYQKYGLVSGRVLQVSRTPLAGSEIAALSLAPAGSVGLGAQPLFRITVALDADAQPGANPLPPLPLVAGMRMSADVLLERRRLVEWLFEPLLGWQQRS
jgi:membrane fusion protein